MKHFSLLALRRDEAVINRRNASDTWKLMWTIASRASLPLVRGKSYAGDVYFAKSYVAAKCVRSIVGQGR
jgi:hypothetical protein